MKTPKAARMFKSTEWLRGVGSYDKVAIWSLTHPNPIEYMDIIEACANGEPLSQLDATVIIIIMETPRFMKPRLDKKQLKIYKKAYERYCSEVVFKIMETGK